MNAYELRIYQIGSDKMLDLEELCEISCSQSCGITT